MSLKKRIADFILKFRTIDEFRIFLTEKRIFFAEAERKFVEEKPDNGSFSDYKKSFRRHRVTYKEYMYSYEFWRLGEAARDKFISTSQVQCIYRKLGDARVREIFSDKLLFLDKFGQFVSRRWLDAANCQFQEFYDLVTAADCIAKPAKGSRGAGIFKIRKDGIDDVRALFENARRDGMLIEECVRACDEIESLHPSSLNTIRVVTVSNGSDCEIFAALLRMGAHGSVVDNTHSGGIFAPINVSTGVIETPATDNSNNRYECHPDTGERIVGFRIPHWDKIIETCKTASREIPNIRFSGWDIAVLPGGEIEMIEGNHAPDFDGGMQAPLKKGVKYEFAEVTRRVLGVNPLDYISIYCCPLKTKNTFF